MCSTTTSSASTFRDLGHGAVLRRAAAAEGRPGRPARRQAARGLRTPSFFYSARHAPATIDDLASAPYSCASGRRPWRNRGTMIRATGRGLWYRPAPARSQSPRQSERPDPEGRRALPYRRDGRPIAEERYRFPPAWSAGPRRATGSAATITAQNTHCRRTVLHAGLRAAGRT